MTVDLQAAYLFLLDRQNRHGRIVLLARHRSGDRDRDDDGLCHAVSALVDYAASANLDCTVAARICII